VNWRFLEKRGLNLSIIVFSVLGIFLWLATDGKISLITSDIDMYNHYVITRFPGIASESAYAIEALSERISYFQETGWTPSPVYSLVFLSPIWLFNSEFLLWLLGMAMGVGTLLLLAIVLNKNFGFLPNAAKSVVLLLYPLNFNFLVDSVGVSTMSVAAFFVIGAFASANRYLKSFLLVIAAMIRSNFLIALLALYLACFVVGLPRKRQLLLDCVPALIVSLLFYRFFYSTYPGGGLNYLLFAKFQGIDYAIPFSRYLLDSLYGVTDVDAMNYAMSIGDSLRLLARFDSLAYLFNLSVLKLSITLGFIHEKLFQSEWGFHLTKLWRTIGFLGLTLPGFYSSVFLLGVAKITALEKCAYLWSILYLLMNSLLIGDPRYLMGTYFILSIALVRIWLLVRGGVSEVACKQ
tara:strand:- start:27 stop:1247 length:1221 start_codon:yes stop_codon:yes gene_type:complete